MMVVHPSPSEVARTAVVLDKLLAEAHGHADRGDPREAIEAADRALGMARERQDPERIARAHMILAQARRVTADYPRSLAAGQEALDWLDRAATDRGRGQCLVLIGHVYLDLGDYAACAQRKDSSGVALMPA